MENVCLRAGGALLIYVVPFNSEILKVDKAGGSVMKMECESTRQQELAESWYKKRRVGMEMPEGSRERSKAK